jgi:hypothetical protein
MGKISLADLIQKSQELREWLEIPPAVLTEEIFKLVEDGTDSEKLEKIKTHILGHPQPLLIIGHILGLIKGMTAADSA